jgi:hypothetical protein
MQRLNLNFHNDELITNFDSQSAGGESSSDFRIIKCPLCHRNVNLNANHSSSQDAVSQTISKNSNLNLVHEAP